MIAAGFKQATLAQSCETGLEQGVVDRILVCTAVFAVGALVFAQLRAMRIGWEVRDAVQIGTVLAMVGLALARHRVRTRAKAVLLVSVLVLGGMSGFYTLGMLGGTVFLLPASMVVVSLLYSTRTTVLFWLLLSALCFLVGWSFCSGRVVAPDVVQLMACSSHWSVYIGCVLLFSGISCMTLLSYRRHVRELLDQLSEQRDQLAAANGELKAASADVKRLSGLIPICSSCKRVRDDSGYWEQVECYIRDHSEAQFSHGLCPDCLRELYPEYLDEMDDDPNGN